MRIKLDFYLNREEMELLQEDFNSLEFGPVVPLGTVIDIEVEWAVIDTEELKELSFEDWIGKWLVGGNSLSYSRGHGLYLLSNF